MTIVVVALRDDVKRAGVHREFEGPDCAALASLFYQRLLEDAMFLNGEKKPRVILTRIIL